MTALVTAIYGGGYDTLKPFVEQSKLVDAVCVTDDPHLESYCWRVVYEPHPDEHPNRAAKRAKACPWRYTDATESVWVDASFRVRSPTFAEDVLSLAQPIAQFVHPWRDCLYEEAAASLELTKYACEPIPQQVAHYRALGIPAHWGLWAGGVIARRHTKAVREFGEHWLRECQRWSFQDQVSEPMVLRHHQLRPVALPGDIWGNEWLAYEASGRHA